MAVIQISKMQVRRGQTAQTGFPQLSSGEFGWSIDTQELYIGNGAVAEGSPAVGNTQLITEHNINNFFLFAEEGYQYNSGISVASRVRTIQNKLDDVVNLNDFVDVADLTIAEHTSYIQEAVDYVAKIANGKPLYVPEGQYIVTSTIYISPLVELRGAGAEKTVINNISTASTFQTIDNVSKKFSDGDYSLNGAPRDVRITGFTFVNSTTNASPIMQLDCLSDSIIEQCKFIGDISVGTATTTLATAINFRDNLSYASNKTKNVTIKNCVFHKVSDAIVSNYDISNITITENLFKTLHRGVVAGEALTGLTSQLTGPQHVVISNNTFDTVNRQAIYAGSTSTSYFTDINSVDNYFYNVGNNGQGDTTSTQLTEVIYFGSFGNYSNGDTFDRLIKINGSRTYITGPSTVKSLVNGPVSLTTKSPSVFDIPGGGSGIQVFWYPRSMYQYSTNVANQLFTIEYTINKPSISLIRRGTLEVMVSGTDATVKDTYTASEQTEGDKVTFSAQVDSVRNLVIVSISNQSAFLGNILYTYTVRQ
jgi:hypothetical protein